MINEQMVSVPFRREDRYIVIKRKDLAKVPVAYRSHLVDPMFSLLSHLPHRECLVIESDWPEYEPTWAAIEARATGKPAAQPAAIPKSECPNCLGDALFGCTECEPAAQHQGEPAVVVPEGYCLMPRQLTAENGAKALLLGEFKLQVTCECPECQELEEPLEGCEICDGEGEYAQRHTIPWDQIKFIYSEAVKGLALQPNAVR